MKPWLGEAWLKVGGRNQTKLLDGLAKQVKLVRTTVQAGGLEVPVHGCLCSVDAEWPVLGKPKPINSFRIFWPKLLAQAREELDFCAEHGGEAFITGPGRALPKLMTVPRRASLV